MIDEKVLSTGDEAPDFCLPDQDKNDVCLKDLEGKWAVLYFYPKDDTPGCTTEAIGFTRQLQAFTGANTTILGVSPDSPESHCDFIEKHDLKLTLLSDPEHEVLTLYGVWQLKKQYGREYWGVVRSTFLLDPQGAIAHVWRNVKVKGHVEAVQAKLAEKQSG